MTTYNCSFGDEGRSRTAGAELGGSSHEEGFLRVLDSATRDTPPSVPRGRPLPRIHVGLRGIGQETVDIKLSSKAL